MNSHLPDVCDWCGEPFADGERRAKGYEDLDTHEKCAREARRAWRMDQGITLAGATQEREPFTDWPNGQGTYD